MSRFTLSRLAATLVAPALVILSSAACRNLAPANQAVMVAPTAQPTATSTPKLPPVELVATFLIDTTTSANRFASDARALFAQQVAAWPEPGRGGLEFYLSRISSTSYDAASTLLTGTVEGLAAPPVRRQTSSRPAEPDLAGCQSNAFGRARCEAELTEEYNAALAQAVADEQEAAEELPRADAAFDDLVERRRAGAAALADQLASVALPVDDRGTDIAGALARASEQLHASAAPRKVLVAWSDFESFGPQQPGRFSLGGIEVVVILDCPQGADCTARREQLTAEFMSLGASSVRWLDPATAQFADLFEEVS